MTHPHFVIRIYDKDWSWRVLFSDESRGMVHSGQFMDGQGRRYKLFYIWEFSGIRHE